MKTTSDLWVGDRLVRPTLGEIERGLDRVHVEPRAMEVLLVLVEHHRKVVSKKELIDEVWGEAFVTEGVITRAISDLRRALGDNATDPEFIQTIPKRGYRLIAPLTEPEQEKEPEPRAPISRRPMLWVLLLLAALIAVTVWMSRERDAPPPPGIGPELVLLPTRAAPESEEQAREIDDRLLRELAGTPGLQIRSAESCEARVGPTESYCLKTSVRNPSGVNEAAATLERAPTGELVYSAAATSPDPSAAAGELSDRVRTYFEVIAQRHWNDPDFMPWISLQKNDIGAVKEFLLGVEYIFVDREGGARTALQPAIEQDPDFVAPRVLRTPSMVAEESPETLAAHRAELERLWSDATDFEKAMIQWAIALIDDRPGDQITHLEAALVQEPGNRPALLALGAALLLGQGDPDAAWDEALQRLLIPPWAFPGLYTLAAECARRRGSVEDLRFVVNSALELDSPDSSVSALQGLLSVYDGNTEALPRLRRRLERAARDSELDLGPFARLLADRAAGEGRKEIAEKIREFSD